MTRMLMAPTEVPCLPRMGVVVALRPIGQTKIGGTDLALAFNERDTEFLLIDCAGIHADAIARLAAT